MSDLLQHPLRRRRQRPAAVRGRGGSVMTGVVMVPTLTWPRQGHHPAEFFTSVKTASTSA